MTLHFINIIVIVVVEEKENFAFEQLPKKEKGTRTVNVSVICSTVVVVCYCCHVLLLLL